MTKIDSKSSYFALSVGHMAGAIDLAALPLWIGALMEYYHLTPPQAGLAVTVFLGSVVLVSAILAPRFNRLHHRYFAVSGFALAAISFFILSKLPVSAENFELYLIFHVISGLGVGASLSMTHGAIGKTKNPHRMFGVVNIAMGALAIVMFAALPSALKTIGGNLIFLAFAVTVAVAAIVAFFLFPTIEKTDDSAKETARKSQPIPAAAWMIIGVIVCLTISQATVFSYAERIGAAREFGMDKVQMTFVIMGFIDLLPGALAALLQKKLSPLLVGFVGPVLQAILALTMTHSESFITYAIPVSLYVTLVVFTHTFLFGLLSKIDASGRAVAATPAMMMLGSATGPLLGGMIVAHVGFHGLGWAVAVLACIACILITLARSLLSQTTPKSSSLKNA